MRKFLMFFIVFGVFIGIVIGASNEINKVDETDSGDKQIVTEIIPKLRLALAGVDTYNPLTTQNEHVSNVLRLIYEPLFELDHENQLKPCLASEYFKRGDNSWVIRLQSNVEWQDGNVLLADDVIYTINYLKDENVNSVYKANVRNISSVERLDTETVVINLIEDDPYIMSKLYFPIVSSRAVATTDEIQALTPQSLIGTGPYEFVSEDAEKVLLKLNDTWWDYKGAKLKEIELIKYGSYAEAVKAFKSTEIDLIMTDMYSWKEKFGFIGINSYSYESSTFETLIPNASKGGLAESSVRKAILQAINRANLVSVVYEENATIKDIPIPSYSKFKTEVSDYNTEKAKQILVNAGWSNSLGTWKKGNQTLSFNLIVVESNKEQVLVAEKIKSDLQEVGIKISIKKMSWNDFYAAISNGTFDLAVATFDVKNEYQIQDMVKSATLRNYAKYSNSNVDALIEKLTTTQEEAYDETMQEFVTTYLNEMPYIGLYFKNNTILANKSVKGEYKSTASNPYKNLINFYK